MTEDTMCPRCGQANPSQNRYCGSCGARIAEGTAAEASPEGKSGLVPDLRIPHALARTGESKALATLSKIGKPLAVAALALVAEAGAVWLSRRAIRGESISPVSIPPSAEEPLRLEVYEEVLLIAEDRARLGWYLARGSGAWTSGIAGNPER